MPLYEFHCEECKRKFEVYYAWKSGDGINFIDDPTMQECPVDSEHKVEFLDSLYSPRPDDMWMGVMTDAGYFTSKKAWDDARHRDKYGNKIELYDVTNRADREYLDKHVVQERKDKEKKEEKALDKVIGQMVMDYDFSPDDAHIVGKNQETYATDADIQEMKDEGFSEQQIAAYK